ncbi:unnamed protein product [Brassicogethes aeneus]|uniref:RNA helicase n=1 Tax=Brassicogethes aeneus TaxID=1431903 RepID=A0A9P0B1R3_BRAAE|nr:unnamed protein product [Brassicogethes aeneus]
MEKKTMLVQDILHLINKDLPKKFHRTTLSEMSRLGTSKQIEMKIGKFILERHSNNLSDVIGVPVYNLNIYNRLWNCFVAVKWPEPVVLLGVGMNCENAYHDALVGAMIWLEWKFNSQIVESVEMRVAKSFKANVLERLGSSVKKPEVLVNQPIQPPNQPKASVWDRLGPPFNKPEIPRNLPIQPFIFQGQNRKPETPVNKFIPPSKVEKRLVAIVKPETPGSWSPIAQKTSQPKNVNNNNNNNVFTTSLQKSKKNPKTAITEMKTDKVHINVNKSFLKRLLLQTEMSNKVTGRRSFSTSTEDKKPPAAEPIEVSYDESDSSKQTAKLFPQPKNALHNMFDILATELRQKDLKAMPKYKLIHQDKASHWTCLYHLKWPCEIKVTADSRTKQEASRKAAIAALTWFFANKKISSDAQPLVVDKNQIKQLHKDTLPVLKLSDGVKRHLAGIYDLHKSRFEPVLLQEAEERRNKGVTNVADEPVVQPDLPVLPNVRKQRFISFEKYKAKEAVKLPISKYKDDFIKLLKNNNVIVLKGEPGCGKSTRIPQYVLEAWAKEDGLNGKPCRIAVTQPRRIAAITLAERVSQERNEALGTIVGYHVRLKNNFSEATGRVLYCTTGILLRRLQSDPTLSSFTHVLLDEAHERDVNTDLLMNLLRDSLKTNPDLKVVVMSATIDTDLFQRYFDGAPVMEIPGFAYPVKRYFLDDCHMDVRRTLKMCGGSSPSVIHDDVARVISYIHKSKDEGAILVFLPGWDDIKKLQNVLPFDGTLSLYCLHSRLNVEEQFKVFSRPPPGVRKLILATNIAETSVTIDDVAYVVDTGIFKQNRFDMEKGYNCIDSHWISKASSTQRKGRAGRVKPGECFHLYTKSAFEKFDDYSMPEILRTSLTKIVLDAKVISDNMDALEFMSRLPCPPESGSTLRAVDDLKGLDLLDDSEKITPLGRTLSNFQVEPKLAKAMVNSVVFKCATPIIDIVTLFSADSELFSLGLSDKEATQKVKRQFSRSSDHLALMRIFEKYLEFVEEGDRFMLEKFCRETELIPNRLVTVEKLRKLHFDYLYNGLYDVLPVSDDFSDNDELVKAVLYSGIGTVLKHRNWDVVKNRTKNNVNVLLTRHDQKATITPESVNCKRTKYPSNYLLYINETRSNIRKTTIIRESSLISDLTVLLFTHKKLLLVDVLEQEQSSKIKSKNQVKIRVKDTNIEFLCDKGDAENILRCKEALEAIYEYYIEKLTQSAEINENVNDYWDSILTSLTDILTEIEVN